MREALSRLHTEGLVERHVDGGYVPAVPDLDAITELYEVRAGLERTAIARDGERDVDALVALRSDWQAIADELDPAQGHPAGLDFVLLDEDFHLRLAGAAGNGALVGVLAGVNERIRIVRMHDFVTAARIEATVAQHLGIVDRMLAGDALGARDALLRHLEESAAVVQRRAAHALARMVSGIGGAT